MLAPASAFCSSETTEWSRRPPGHGSSSLFLVGLLAAIMLSPRHAYGHSRDGPGNEGDRQGEGSVPSRPAAKDTVTGDRFTTPAVCSTPTVKPFAGDQIHLAYLGYQWPGPAADPRNERQRRPIPDRMHRQDFADTTHETPWKSAQVVATAAGFGLAWADALHEGTRTATANLTIRLARGDAPIRASSSIFRADRSRAPRCAPRKSSKQSRATSRHGSPHPTSGSGGSWEIERKYLKRKLWPRGSGLPVVITTDARAVLDRRRRTRAIDSTEHLRPDDPDQGDQRCDTNVSPFHVNHGQRQPGLGDRPVLRNSVHACGRTDPADDGRRHGQGHWQAPLAGVGLRRTKQPSFRSTVSTVSRRPPTNRAGIG